MRYSIRKTNLGVGSVLLGMALTSGVVSAEEVPVLPEAVPEVTDAAGETTPVVEETPVIEETSVVEEETALEALDTASGITTYATEEETSATEETPVLKYNAEKGYPESTQPGDGTIYIGDKVVDDAVRDGLSKEELAFVDEIQYLLDNGVVDGKVVFPTLQALVDEGIVTQDGDQWTAHLKGGETLNDLDLVFETEDGTQFSFDQIELIDQHLSGGSVRGFYIPTYHSLFGSGETTPVFSDGLGFITDHGFDNTYGYFFEWDVPGYASPVLNAFKDHYDISGVYHPLDQYRLGLIDLATFKEKIQANPENFGLGAIYFYLDPRTGDYARVSFTDPTGEGKLGVARFGYNTNYGLISEDVDADTLSHISRGIDFGTDGSLNVFRGLAGLAMYDQHLSGINTFLEDSDTTTFEHARYARIQKNFKDHKETLEDLLGAMPIYQIFSEQIGINVIKESFDTVAQWALDHGYADQNTVETFREGRNGTPGKYNLMANLLSGYSGLLDLDGVYGVGNPWMMDYDRILEATPDLSHISKTSGEMTQVVNYLKRVPTPKGHVLKIDQDGNVLEGESFESGDGLINYGEDFKYEIKKTPEGLAWYPVFQHEAPYYVGKDGKVYRMEYLYGPSLSVLDVARDRREHPERYELSDWLPYKESPEGDVSDLGNFSKWILDHVPGARDVRTYPGMEDLGISISPEALSYYDVYDKTDIESLGPNPYVISMLSTGKGFGTTAAEGTYPVMMMVYKVDPTAPDPVITTVTETIPFETEYVDDPNLPVGEEAVDQEGVNGEKTITTTTLTIDGEDVYSNTEEKITKEPVSAIVRRGTKEAEIVGDLTPLEPAEGIVEDLTPLEPAEEIVEDLTPLEPAEEIVGDLTPLEPAEEIVGDLTPLEPAEEIVSDLTPLEPAEEIKEDIPLTPLEPAEEVQDAAELTPAEKAEDAAELTPAEKAEDAAELTPAEKAQEAAELEPAIQEAPEAVEAQAESTEVIPVATSNSNQLPETGEVGSLVGLAALSLFSGTTILGRRKEED